MLVAVLLLGGRQAEGLETMVPAAKSEQVVVCVRHRWRWCGVIDFKRAQVLRFSALGEASSAHVVMSLTGRWDSALSSSTDERVVVFARSGAQGAAAALQFVIDGVRTTRVPRSELEAAAGGAKGLPGMLSLLEVKNGGCVVDIGEGTTWVDEVTGMARLIQRGRPHPP
jgi:hypothetical protein